jgi:adenine/guanine phosphoribosyltransferase-like PRPP-binding protein
METTNRLPTATIVELLSRGGLSAPTPDTGSTPATPMALPKYNALQDPRASEQLARDLAEELRRYDPAILLIWQAPHDIVLGFVVARELGISAIRSYDLEGLVGYDGAFEDGGRLVLVADAFREAEPVRAMCALARQQGHPVVAAGALVSIQGPGLDELNAQDVPLVSLVGLDLAAGDWNPDE